MGHRWAHAGCHRELPRFGDDMVRPTSCHPTQHQSSIRRAALLYPVFLHMVSPSLADTFLPLPFPSPSPYACPRPWPPTAGRQAGRNASGCVYWRDRTTSIAFIQAWILRPPARCGHTSLPAIFITIIIISMRFLILSPFLLTEL